MYNYTRARENQASLLAINNKKIKMMKKTIRHLPGFVDIMSGCVRLVSIPSHAAIRLLGGLFQLFSLDSTSFHHKQTRDEG